MTSRDYTIDAKEVKILIVVNCFKIGVKLGGCLTLRYMGKQISVPLILLSSVYFKIHASSHMTIWAYGFTYCVFITRRVVQIVQC